MCKYLSGFYKRIEIYKIKNAYQSNMRLSKSSMNGNYQPCFCVRCKKCCHYLFIRTSHLTMRK